MNVIQYEDSGYRKKQEQIEKDIFAAGFAEWSYENYFRVGIGPPFWTDSVDWHDCNKFTTEELLEIYKKEKGL